METIYLPKGCLEIVGENDNTFKVCKELMEKEPKQNEIVKFFMLGSGYTYKGLVYHKTPTHIYIKLYNL